MDGEGGSGGGGGEDGVRGGWVVFMGVGGEGFGKGCSGEGVRRLGGHALKRRQRT